MTSSKHLGDNKTAMVETSKISNFLKMKGYNVLREKIESVPYHPSAPREFDKKSKMQKDCYFESHIGVKIHNSNDLERLKSLCKSYNYQLHLSKNFFKKNLDGSYIIMITLRNYDCVLESFQSDVEDLKKCLSCDGFEYEKVIIEFSVYDSKISHDLE